MLRCEGVCLIPPLLLASTLFEEATPLPKDLQISCYIGESQSVHPTLSLKFWCSLRRFLSSMATVTCSGCHCSGCVSPFIERFLKKLTRYKQHHSTSPKIIPALALPTCPTYLNATRQIGAQQDCYENQHPASLQVG